MKKKRKTRAELDPYLEDAIRVTVRPQRILPKPADVQMPRDSRCALSESWNWPYVPSNGSILPNYVYSMHYRYGSATFVSNAMFQDNGLWAATCFCCVFLAFNRTWELMIPSKAYIFEGRFMYFWILLPTCYFMFFTFFERPLLYDPRLHTFLFDPRTNISQQLDPHIYANLPHTINNSIVIVCLLAFYPIICASLAYQMKRNQASRISTMTKQIILQSMVICGCHFVGCFLYVYTQYFPVPSIFTIISNLAWIGNHGLPGIVYFSLNKTIRSRVLALFGIRRTEVSKIVIKPHTRSFGHP